MRNRMFRVALVATALLGSGLATLAWAPSASAGIPVLISVGVTADVVDANTTPPNISLREAVTIANDDGQENIIVLALDQTYVLTDCASIGNEDEDLNGNGDLDLLDGVDITIDGNGSTIDQTCDGERVVEKLGTGDLTLDEVTITGGTPNSGGGGGVLVGVGLNVENSSLITDNIVSSGNGGGARSGGPLLVEDSAVAGNTTVSGGGGGVSSFDDVFLTRASITENRSFTGSGAVFGQADVFVESSTVAHNLAENNGGISGTNIFVEYSTIFANSGRQGFVTDNLAAGLTLTAFASIIGLGGPSGDCGAANFVSNGFNLGYDQSCELDHPTDLPGTYAHVNVPGVGGTGTQTLSHPPVVPSRAIDRIPPACGAGFPDQLGTTRPINGSCDVGAREVAPDPCGQLFSDVSLSHPFFEEICWMGQTGISTGFLDQTFKPGSPVTRQSMAAFIYRLAGTPPYNPQGETFNDVSTGHPFYAEIEWMAETGIATGFDGDVYLPGANVTRQAMSAFMYRVAGEPSFFPVGQTFTDVSPAHPFYKEIEWMADEGISTGFLPGPQYRPSIPVTRQAMSAFMLRLAEGPELLGL